MNIDLNQPLFKMTHLDANGRPCSDAKGIVLTAAEARERLYDRPRMFRFKLEPVTLVPPKPARAAAAMKTVREFVRKRNTRAADGMLFTPRENKLVNKIEARFPDIHFLAIRINKNGKRCGVTEIAGASTACVDLRCHRVEPGRYARHDAEPVAIAPLPASERRAAMRLLRRAAA
jgi:hypothetical protein